jgi:outer membrane protein assembly factor BamA
MCQRESQREAPEVRQLVLNGVHGVSRYDLQRSIATTPSQCKSLLLIAFCWVSKSPTFVDKNYLDHDEFRRDVLRILVFYWKRGWRNATVDTAITRVGPGAVKVVFDIHEGEPTRIASWRVEYDSTLMSPRRVKKLSFLRAGDPLNLVVLDTVRMQFQLEMWNKGYADAVIDTVIQVDPVARTANVLLRVDPRYLTHVGTITVRGNEDVKASTIQNSIMIHPGKIFRYVDYSESQRNLYESNLFRLAMFTVPPNQGPVKNLLIDVREARLREAHTEAGFSNIDFFQTRGTFTNYNTFGGARRLDVTTTVGNLGATSMNGRGLFRQIDVGSPFTGESFLQPTWQVSADVRQPSWLRKPENQLAFGIFAHRRAAPAVYIDRGYGSQLSFTRVLGPRASASAAYRFEITRVEASDVYFCVNYAVCDTATVDQLQLHHKLSPLQLSAAIDRTDIPFSPTKGYLARVDIEHASSVTMSDYRYNRLYADAAGYTHFLYPSRDPRAQVLAGHIRVGFVRALASGVGPGGIEELHPSKRLYAGGSHSVRGYDENMLGPRVLTIPPNLLANAGCDTTTTVAIQACNPNAASLRNGDFMPRPVGGTALLEGSVEIRVPFARKMSWAAFLDGGLVGGTRLRSIQDVAQVIKGTGAITPGVGFRYKSPVGPVRVDLGYNPTTSEQLTVVTTARDANGLPTLVTLRQPRTFTTGGTSRGLLAIFNRVVLHLSIGEAY